MKWREGRGEKKSGRWLGESNSSKMRQGGKSGQVSEGNWRATTTKNAREKVKKAGIYGQIRRGR